MSDLSGKIIQSPLVSIGLPVFNGEAHLDKTIEALLGQTYRNIELLICNNASTDATEEIAEKFAKLDQRVRYFKNERNIGVVGNFNLALSSSIGEYFMWAACDDLHGPEFIEECVKRLEANPNAALCQTRVSVCLETPEQILYSTSLGSFKGKNASVQRFIETLKHFPAVAVYGLFRSSFAKSIVPIRNQPGGDLLWILELSLVGDFIESDKYLFTYIARPEWNTYANDLKNLGYDTSRLGSRFSRIWLEFRDQYSTILRSDISKFEKIFLIGVIVDHRFKKLFLRVALILIETLKVSQFSTKIHHKIYFQFIHNPNIVIVDLPLFKSRVIRPIIEGN